MPKPVAQKKYPYVFTTLKQRQDALVMPKDFKPDKILANLLANAEKMYEPKQVFTKEDWLETQEESG